MPTGGGKWFRSFLGFRNGLEIFWLDFLGFWWALESWTYQKHATFIIIGRVFFHCRRVNFQSISQKIGRTFISFFSAFPSTLGLA